ncbi:uncharacterized protein LOC135140132 [Zophobas morio]|uniref:uncharacterized protein LOC135140132 n=1 Tax=Zophobas morio TaxID=2755281 RepID=UPI003082AAB7
MNNNRVIVDETFTIDVVEDTDFKFVLKTMENRSQCTQNAVGNVGVKIELQEKNKNTKIVPANNTDRIKDEVKGGAIGDTIELAKCEDNHFITEETIKVEEPQVWFTKNVDLSQKREFKDEPLDATNCDKQNVQKDNPSKNIKSSDCGSVTGPKVQTKIEMTSTSHEKTERGQSVIVENTGNLEQQVPTSPSFWCTDSKSVDKKEEIEIYDCEDWTEKTSGYSYDVVKNVYVIKDEDEDTNEECPYNDNRNKQFNTLGTVDLIEDPIDVEDEEIPQNQGAKLEIIDLTEDPIEAEDKQTPDLTAPTSNAVDTENVSSSAETSPSKEEDNAPNSKVPQNQNAKLSLSSPPVETSSTASSSSEFQDPVAIVNPNKKREVRNASSKDEETKQLRRTSSSSEFQDPPVTKPSVPRKPPSPKIAEEKKKSLERRSSSSEFQNPKITSNQKKKQTSASTKSTTCRPSVSSLATKKKAPVVTKDILSKIDALIISVKNEPALDTDKSEESREVGASTNPSDSRQSSASFPRENLKTSCVSLQIEAQQSSSAKKEEIQKIHSKAIPKRRNSASTVQNNRVNLCLVSNADSRQDRSNVRVDKTRKNEAPVNKSRNEEIQKMHTSFNKINTADTVQINSLNLQSVPNRENPSICPTSRQDFRLDLCQNTSTSLNSFSRSRNNSESRHIEIPSSSSAREEDIQKIEGLPDIHISVLTSGQNYGYSNLNSSAPFSNKSRSKENQKIDLKSSTSKCNSSNVAPNNPLNPPHSSLDIYHSKSTSIEALPSSSIRRNGVQKVHTNSLEHSSVSNAQSQNSASSSKQDSTDRKKNVKNLIKRNHQPNKWATMGATSKKLISDQEIPKVPKMSTSTLGENRRKLARLSQRLDNRMSFQFTKTQSTESLSKIANVDRIPGLPVSVPQTEVTLRNVYQNTNKSVHLESVTSNKAKIQQIHCLEGEEKIYPEKSQVSSHYVQSSLSSTYHINDVPSKQYCSEFQKHNRDLEVAQNVPGSSSFRRNSSSTHSEVSPSMQSPRHLNPYISPQSSDSRHSNQHCQSSSKLDLSRLRVSRIPNSCSSVSENGYVEGNSDSERQFQASVMYEINNFLSRTHRVENIEAPQSNFQNTPEGVRHPETHHLYDEDDLLRDMRIQLSQINPSRQNYHGRDPRLKQQNTFFGCDGKLRLIQQCLWHMITRNLSEPKDQRDSRHLEAHLDRSVCVDEKLRAMEQQLWEIIIVRNLEVPQDNIYDQARFLERTLVLYMQYREVKNLQNTNTSDVSSSRKDCHKVPQRIETVTSKLQQPSTSRKIETESHRIQNLKRPTNPSEENSSPDKKLRVEQPQDLSMSWLNAVHSATPQLTTESFNDTFKTIHEFMIGVMNPKVTNSASLAVRLGQFFGPQILKKLKEDKRKNKKNSKWSREQ